MRILVLHALRSLRNGAAPWIRQELLSREDQPVRLDGHPLHLFLRRLRLVGIELGVAGQQWHCEPVEALKFDL